jgi:hypothetical protein
MRTALAYRPRQAPLQLASPPAAIAYLGSLAFVAFVFSSPIVLAGAGAAVVVAGVVYAGSTYGSIVGADARTGRTLIRFPHGEYVPVSGSGDRLLFHGYSRLYAVDPVKRR